MENIEMICAGCTKSTGSSRIELSVALEGRRVVSELVRCSDCETVCRNLSRAVLGKADRVWTYPPPPERPAPPVPSPQEEERPAPPVPSPQEERLIEGRQNMFSPKSLAQMKGFTGDPCGTCGQLMMVRSGTCLTCKACGAADGGCS
jgi:hypothetical protein